jgi:Trypsin-like peptidase domain
MRSVLVKKYSIMKTLLHSIFIAFFCPTLLLAQTDDTPIHAQSQTARVMKEKDIADKMQQLRKEVTLLGFDEIQKRLQNPQPRPIDLLPPSSDKMDVESIAAHAVRSQLRVGYCYLCPHCDKWHLNLAGGYAIAPDVIVTCHHVVDSKSEMREAYLLVIDHKDNIAGVTNVLASSEVMDACVLQVEGAKFTPTPFNNNIRAGAASYCYSTPLKQNGYFSDGIVNRFYWNYSAKTNNDKNKLDDARHLRVNFSNDWAPGSSGSPLFDQSGNVIGHVSTISTMSSDPKKSAQITLHEGVAAHAVMKLVEAMKDPEEITRLATMEAKAKKVLSKIAKKQPKKATPPTNAKDGATKNP